MRGSRKFCQRGSNFDLFFVLFFKFSLMRGGKIQVPLLADSETSFKWCFAGVVIMA